MDTGTAEVSGEGSLHVDTETTEVMAGTEIPAGGGGGRAGGGGL